MLTLAEGLQIASSMHIDYKLEEQPSQPLGIQWNDSESLIARPTNLVSDPTTLD